MIREWLRAFLPAPVNASVWERLRGCCGALVGLLLTGLTCTWLAGSAAVLPLLIAPLGASAVLLFAVPASPLAQPWSIIGGNTASALVGVTCAHWIPDPALAAPIAAAVAIGVMFALRCLHPPGGAIALTAVLGGPAVTAAGYHFVLSPVALNSAVLMVAAVIFNNATRRAYPHRQQAARANPHGTADLVPTERLGVQARDLDAALQQYGEVLDVSRDDLDSLVQQAEMHAYRRRFGAVTCADIMSRDVVTVRTGTRLVEAWRLLRQHDIRALPVVDATGRAIGIVTDAELMKSPDFHPHDGLRARLRHLMRGLPAVRQSRPRLVGQVMAPVSRVAAGSTHVAELVPLMADAGLRHIPVVDHHRRLCGIIAQSDLIAALYRGSLMSDGLEAAAE